LGNTFSGEIFQRFYLSEVQTAGTYITDGTPTGLMTLAMGGNCGDALMSALQQARNTGGPLSGMA